MEKLITPDFGLSFWTVLNFALLVLLLSKFVWKPLVSALEQREADIKADREAAENARRDAEKVKAELDTRMASLAQETRDVLAAASQEGKKERDAIIASAQENAARLIARARQEMSAEQVRLMGELRHEIAGIALMAAERVMQKQVDASVNQAMVDGLLKEIEARAGEKGK